MSNGGDSKLAESSNVDGDIDHGNRATVGAGCMRKLCTPKLLSDQQAKNDELVGGLRDTLRRAKNSLASSELYLESIDKPHLMWNAMAAEYSSSKLNSEQVGNENTQIDEESAEFARQLEQTVSESGELCAQLERGGVENVESLLRKVDELIERTKMMNIDNN